MAELKSHVSPLHILQDIFNIPENTAAAEILVPAAVGDGFGRIVPLVAVGDFEEFIGPGRGFVIGGRRFGAFKKLVFSFRFSVFGVGKAGVRRAEVSGQGPGVN